MTLFCDISPIDANTFLQGLKWDIDDIKLAQPHFSIFIITFGIFFFMDESICTQELEKFSEQVYVKRFFADLYNLVMKFKILSIHHWRIHRNLYQEIITQYLKARESEMGGKKLLPRKKETSKRMSNEQQQLGLIKDAIAYVVRRK